MRDGETVRPPDVPRVELAEGYDVPRILNGGWQLSAGHRATEIDESTVIPQLLRLVEAGLDTFDCGDIYVGVEELLGRLVRETAARIRVHTKFVPDLADLGSLDRAYVGSVVDRSLRRLGVERLDLVQLAWWDYSVPRYVEVAGWLEDLRRAGKIRLLGATNFDVPRLREIVDAGIPIRCHQVQYSLLDRRPERGMTAFCRERDIHLLSYGSLAGGFLSDRHLGEPEPSGALANRSLTKYRLIIDELGGWGRFQELLQALRAVASRHEADVANVALSWVLERPGVAAAIVGTTGASHLEANLRALRIRLGAWDHRLLEPFEGLGPPGDVYEVERDRSGPHGRIMKYDLHRRTDGPE